MSIFERATRLKMRFDTQKGPLGVEDLWDLPLTSNSNRANLDEIARKLHRQLNNGDDVSFVEPDRKSNENIQLAFDVVKHVIDVRLAERKKASEEVERKERKQELLSIIKDRKSEDLRKMSLEDLQKMVEAL